MFELIALLKRTFKNNTIWKKISKCVKFATKTLHLKKTNNFFKVR